jgi:hypothetical protein
LWSTISFFTAFFKPQGMLKKNVAKKQGLGDKKAANLSYKQQSASNATE